ncbi:MAG: hypothetical protein II897_04060 [Clostridia bacterium]|nr:hypothetical protein [Clostridia bacterium]
MKQFTHKYDENNVVRSILKDDGTMVYVLNDIAKCVGYKAPRKFTARAEVEKEYAEIAWRNGVRHGRTPIAAVTYTNFLKIAEIHMFPEEIVDFIKEIENAEY